MKKITVDWDSLIKEEIKAQKEKKISTLWFLISLGIFTAEEIEKIEEKLHEATQNRTQR